MPEALREALRRLAKATGHENPDFILARYGLAKPWRRPVKWWLE
jgi:hypothetical protein